MWVRPDLGELSRIRVQREVVAKITQSSTQVQLEVAESIQPGIRLGETLDVSVAVPAEKLTELIRDRRDVLDWLVESKKRGQGKSGRLNAQGEKSRRRWISRGQRQR